MLQHDTLLRAAARAIYDACYPGDEWAPLGFEDAERYATVHYRQAVGAAIEARAVLAAPVQPDLFGMTTPERFVGGQPKTIGMPGAL